MAFMVWGLPHYIYNLLEVLIWVYLEYPEKTMRVYHFAIKSLICKLQ